MKKVFAFVLVLSLFLTSCAALAEDNVLVLYASTPEPYLTDMIVGFEELTGIKVELVSAGTSELYKKVQAEADAPIADILRGGMMWGSYAAIDDFLMDYVSPLNDQLPDNCKCIYDSIYGFNYIGTVIMVNNAELAKLGVEVNGWADLLQPELKGKVTIPDPTQTSSGWEAVVAMLYAMGGGDTEEGWAFIRSIMENGAVMASGSGACHKSVADGEYAIGLVAESMATTYIAEGLDISIVWPEEGTIMNSDGIAAVKNCHHPENAKKFIDYLISDTYQNICLTRTPQLRPVLSDLDIELTLTPVEEITMLDIAQEDYEYLAGHKDDMLDAMKDIMTDFM